MSAPRSAAGGLLALVAAWIGAPFLAGAGAPAPAALPDTVRVLAYNIHHGEGMDEELNLGRIARLIVRLRPDIVALQEVDVGVERTGRVDQAAELGRRTGMAHAFGMFMAYQGGEYGMAVLSRWPILEARNLRLPDGAEPRTSLAVRVRSPDSGREIVVAGVHFYRTEEERVAQARRLSELLAGETVPVILAGDFNSRPGSAALEALAHRWRPVAKGHDRLSFPSYAPDREIDFVLVPAGVEVASTFLVDEPVASDHRPLVTDLVVR